MVVNVVTSLRYIGKIMRLFLSIQWSFFNHICRKNVKIVIKFTVKIIVSQLKKVGK